MKKNITLDSDKSIALGIGGCFAIGTLNTMHYWPNPTFLGESLGLIFLALALIVCYTVKSHFQIGVSAFTWVCLALIIALQPSINDIFYQDELIFPVINLLVVVLVVIGVTSIEDERLFVRWLAIIVLLVGILTVCIQLIQLFNHPNSMPWGIEALDNRLTPYGNLRQRNQAAFVLTLAIAALFYFYHYRKELSLKRHFLGLGCLFLLSTGIGLTSSRGGIILLFSLLAFQVIFSNQQIRKWWFYLLIALMVIIGFTFGAWLVDTFFDNNSIKRFAEQGIATRMSLLNQAWLIFKAHPILGIGWNNFSIGGLEVSSQLDYFFFSRHAHSVLPQVASELGILGIVALVPVTITIVRVIRRQLLPDRLLMLSIVIISLLYSLSEFPLWFNYYLILFVAALAYLEKTHKKIMIRSNVFPKAMTAFLAIVSGIAVYYCIIYWDILQVTYKLSSTNRSDYTLEERKADLNHLEVFGFSSVYETYLFSVMKIDKNNIDKKIELGYRVVSRYTVPEKMRRLALLESINHQPEKSLALFKAACLYQDAINCKETTMVVQEVASQQPDIFSQVEKRYNQWLDKQSFIDKDKF